MKKIKNSFVTNLSFSVFMGLKYFKAKKKISLFIFLLLLAGISGGLTAMITVIGIMNGFQDNHISRKIEIGSYHLTVSKKDNSFFTLEESAALQKRIYGSHKEVAAAVSYTDQEVMIRIKSYYFTIEEIIKLRALDFNEASKDRVFKEYFKITEGNFNYQNASDYILLGEPFFQTYWLTLGENIYLSPNINISNLKKAVIPFKVKSVFKTYSFDYDRYWGFISIDSLKRLTGDAKVEKIGLKLNKVYNKKAVIKKIKNELSDYKVETAEEINRGFFAALRLEKTMMLSLFFLIFLMAGANIYGALKLTIIEKKKDISILKAIGVSPFSIQIIFVIESLILGFAGSLIGIVCGLAFSFNLSRILVFFEAIINGVLFYVFSLIINISFFKELVFSPVVIYDTSIYYQSGFIVKLSFIEITAICLVITVMTFLSAYLPIRAESKLRPSEIIKN